MSSRIAEGRVMAGFSGDGRKDKDALLMVRGLLTEDREHTWRFATVYKIFGLWPSNAHHPHHHNISAYLSFVLSMLLSSPLHFSSPSPPLKPLQGKEISLELLCTEIYPVSIHISSKSSDL
ncbi:hypothetical protein SAY87_003298 [Trapa incisa]|uniref:Uncharacterized protein n=1 Tax=Trapa incisa TaxID=236973 RepID=A0AAN7KSB0_9MYRT|nr:hypothetical protein SAY87_003298 [Trapa incisa]